MVAVGGLEMKWWWFCIEEEAVMRMKVMFCIEGKMTGVFIVRR